MWTQNLDHNIYIKKINVKIKDFFKFTNNHFYISPTESSFKMYKKSKLKTEKYLNEDDINVLEDFIENNSMIDNFSKNFCRLFIKMLYPDIDVYTLGNFISAIIDDINLFYSLYVNYMHEIYAIDSLVCFEKKIKILHYNECIQRTLKNRVAFQSEDQKFILNFILPPKAIPLKSKFYTEIDDLLKNFNL